MAGPAAADAFAERSWAIAYRFLSQVPLADLDPADLDRRAVAAFLMGQDDEAVAAWDHAYQHHTRAGDRAEAARCASPPVRNSEWWEFTSIRRFLPGWWMHPTPTIAPWPRT